MDQDLDEVLSQTLVLLEWRLRRIEYVLDSVNSETESQSSIPTRLEKLEQSLQKLASKSQLVSDASSLRKSLTN